MQVDPDMDFSGSESSDFQEVFNAKDNTDKDQEGQNEQTAEKQTKEIAGLTDVQEEIKIITSGNAV